MTRTNGDDPAQANAPQQSAASDASGITARQAYWRSNLRLAAVLLSIWFVVSFGFGILLVHPLNEIRLFGFKLGFWWAQQGSIYVFIVLIFVYARVMARIDRKHDVHEDVPRTTRTPTSPRSQQR